MLFSKFYLTRDTLNQKSSHRANPVAWWLSLVLHFSGPGFTGSDLWQGPTHCLLIKPCCGSVPHTGLRKTGADVSSGWIFLTHTHTQNSSQYYTLKIYHDTHTLKFLSASEFVAWWIGSNSDLGVSKDLNVQQAPKWFWCLPWGPHFQKLCSF